MSNETPQRAAEQPDEAPANVVTLAFVRGISPSKWQQRWNEVRSRRRLELLPLEATADAPESTAEMTLVRVAPEAFPAGSRGDLRIRHAVQLYEEAVALVVEPEHELAGVASIEADELELVALIDHPDHDPTWPAAEPWKDPSWRPTSIQEALDLVATGVGSMLMPFPLARHLCSKKKHAIIEVTGDLPGSRVFATWLIERDSDELQELMGVLRGRTARSSR